MWTAFGNRYHQQVTSARHTCDDLNNLILRTASGARARGSPAPSSSLRPTSRPRSRSTGRGPGPRGQTCLVRVTRGRGLVTTSRTHTPGPCTAFSPHLRSLLQRSPSPSLQSVFRILSEPVSGMSRSGERCTGVTMSRLRITPWASILRWSSTRPGLASWGRGQRSGSPSRRS